MAHKKSPQMVKSKVVGARLTNSEVAWIDLVRGNQPAGSWLADLVRREKRRWEAAQIDTTP